MAGFTMQDGHPPLGWSETAAYLVLPVLLVVSQYVSMEIMKPPQVGRIQISHLHLFFAPCHPWWPAAAYNGIVFSFFIRQTDDPSQKNSLLVLKFLPLMIGYFSLSVPSGLSIYWFVFHHTSLFFSCL